MDCIGKDVLRCVLVHLTDMMDVGRLGLCNRHLYAALLASPQSDELLWKPRCLQAAIAELTLEHKSWKHAYLAERWFLGWKWETLQKEGGKKKNFLGKMVALLKPRPTLKVVVTGLQGAGKSSAITKLHLGELNANVRETKQKRANCPYKNVDVLMVECGFDQLKIWKPQLDFIFLVVDSMTICDQKEQELVKEFIPWASGNLGKPAFLFLANKQDLPHAQTLASICDLIGLHSLRNLHWYIQAGCCPSGDGLYEALDWMTSLRH